MDSIRPGKPVENAFAEIFNGRLRHECLDTSWFMRVRHAKRTIENWRLDYNTARPHSSLGYRMPDQAVREEEALAVGLA